ncbi:MAG: type II secretion system protein [Candidatus Brennerbacteria bacterium]|nr:type II secretion system protein [Candidatus Brennerbacteria bacterium]
MKNKQSGFTLIEMLVVVAIIGLLSSVVVIGVGGARQKARDTKRVADLRQIQTYLEANYAVGGYPVLSPWPSMLPRDPSTGTETNPGYAYCTSGQTYTIGTDLEDAANKPNGGATASTCTLSMNCSSADIYCVTP